MEETLDTRIDDCNEASKTYHARFKRLCEEENAVVAEMNALLTKGHILLPPEFIVDFDPILRRFKTLFIEFNECMKLIGINHIETCDVFVEGIQERSEIIEQVQEEIKQLKERITRLSAQFSSS